MLISEFSGDANFGLASFTMLIFLIINYITKIDHFTIWDKDRNYLTITVSKAPLFAKKHREKHWTLKIEVLLYRHPFSGLLDAGQEEEIRNEGSPKNLESILQWNFRIQKCNFFPLILSFPTLKSQSYKIDQF